MNIPLRKLSVCFSKTFLVQKNAKDPDPRANQARYPTAIADTSPTTLIVPIAHSINRRFFWEGGGIFFFDRQRTSALVSNTI
jgi:hypothetical protein